jgi:hypothetical protein
MAQTSRILGEVNRVFAEAFSDLFEDDTYVLLLGNKDESGKGVKIAKDSPAASVNGVFGDVGAVLGDLNAPVAVTQHHPWKHGIVWTAWDSTKNQQGQPFYVEHRRKVYLCIDNNDGAMSGNPPSGTNAQIFETDDGYRWQYLYSISGLMNHYMRTLDGVAWMPVQGILSKEKRKALASTNPYFLKHEVEKYGYDNGGELLRIVVKDEAKRQIRWSAINDGKLFEPLVDPDNNAVLKTHANYIGPKDEANVSLRGFQLTSVKVESGGRGYPMAVSIILGKEPETNVFGYDSDIIVGGDTSNLDNDISGPFVYGIASPPTGFADAISLLFANQSMFLVVLDPRIIQQYTDATSWNTAAFVKNPYYNNEPINKTFQSGKQSAQASYFSAATVIKTDDSETAQGLASGNKLSSIAGAGKNTRISGTVSANTSAGGDNRNIRVTGQGANLVSSTDSIFTEIANTSLIAGNYSLAPASSKTPTSALITSVQKTPISFAGNVEFGVTEVLHTFEFPSITMNSDNTHGLCVAFLIGAK